MTAPDSSERACGRCAVGRREFLAAATTVAVLAVLDACTSPTGLSGFSGAPGGPFTVKVSDFAALATVGGIARVDGGHGAPSALVRASATSFRAFSMICTHQGTTINVTSTGFRCPNHGAVFTADGSWLAGQRTTALNSYAATFDAASGTVTIARPT